MRQNFTLLLLLITGILSAQNNDSLIIKSLYTEALSKTQGYYWLEELCKKAPKRLSGSEGAAKAVDLVYQQFKGCGANPSSQVLLFTNENIDVDGFVIGDSDATLQQFARRHRLPLDKPHQHVVGGKQRTAGRRCQRHNAGKIGDWIAPPLAHMLAMQPLFQQADVKLWIKWQ